MKKVVLVLGSFACVALVWGLAILTCWLEERFGNYG